MAARFMIYLPLIFLLPDIYIWFACLQNARGRWKYLHLLSLAAAIAVGIGVVASPQNTIFMYILMVLMIGLYIPKIIFTAISLPFHIAALFRRSLARIGDRIAGTVCTAVILCMVYGLTYGWRKITVNQVTICSDRLPESFDGYRIAQISDLHLGTFQYAPSFIHNIVTTVNHQKADMVCFTGDIVNFRAGELARYATLLSKIKAPDGVYSIMGNHDYCEYFHFESPGGAIHNAEMLIQIENSMGWRMLHNSHRYVVRDSDTIAIVGVENFGEPPFKTYSDLHKALKGVPADRYKLLLSHNPIHWRREVLPKSDVDLMLAGHTHAMQFRIGSFSPSMFRYKEWGGLYSEGGRSMYVNTGTGGNFLFRFGAWPEVTVITLRKSTVK